MPNANRLNNSAARRRVTLNPDEGADTSRPAVLRAASIPMIQGGILAE
jgi:hypothetical protein